MKQMTKLKLPFLEHTVPTNISEEANIDLPQKHRQIH